MMRHIQEALDGRVVLVEEVNPEKRVFFPLVFEFKLAVLMKEACDVKN